MTKIVALASLAIMIGSYYSFAVAVSLALSVFMIGGAILACWIGGEEE